MSNRNTAVIPKGSNIKLTKNFNSDEFDCKCNYSSCTTTLVDLDHVVKLQKLRDLTGPLSITSAYRCKKHNTAVGGSPSSQHMKGTATDLQSKRLSPLIVFETCKALFNGIGHYNTFTHCDSRPGPQKTWDRSTK